MAERAVMALSSRVWAALPENRMQKKQMLVGGIGVDSSGAPIILLQDKEKSLALPIWVGIPEAQAIGMAVNKVVKTRPGTHDLLFSTIKASGYEVKEIMIDALEGDVYRAVIFLENKVDDQIVKLDSRPSDALVIASLSQAPLFVTEEILQQSAITVNLPKEADSQEFKTFLNSVTPADFAAFAKEKLKNEMDENYESENGAN